MHCTVGPSICAECAMVMGKVAMRVHVDTWESKDNSPDCEAAKKLVANMIEEETTYE